MALSYSEATGAGGQNSLADLFARYKYKETIGLLYLHNEKAEISDVLELLRKLNIDRIHVEGIQRDSEKWYSRLLIKFKPQFANVFERVKKLDGNVLLVRGGEARVIIQDMTGEIKYVSVYGVPFEVPNSAVEELMSRFGQVKDIRMIFFQQNLCGIATGTRCVKMIIQREIPSCIKIGNRSINISYSGQV